MSKKDIRLTLDDSYDADRNGEPEADEILESTVGQLLDAEAGHEEDSLEIASPGSRTTLNGAGRRSKEKEIEALLERMVFSEKAFLEYPN